MRGRRRDEPDLWGDLYDRFRGPADPSRRPRGTGLPPDTSGRLIDAAIGILGAIRTFVDVAEDALEERRARLDDAPRPTDRWVRAPETVVRPVGDPDDSAVVRDIPLAGS